MALTPGLYGMHQFLWIWNHALSASFLDWGFTCSECEWCICLHCSDNGDMSIVIVHVDDMAAASSYKAEADCFCTELESTWQITTLGEPKLIVGIALC